MKGKFILFEGPHGSGKTTLAKKLESYYMSKDIPSVYTKEPYLEEIKNVIEKYLSINFVNSAYMLLYLHAADRIAHVRFIEDKLKMGYNVICDRYLISSLVYQQMQGIPLEFIEQINSFCIESDITFIIDVPLTERIDRLTKINRLRNTLFFTKENLKHEQKLYQEAYHRYKHKWKNVFLIDGQRGINDVFKEITSLL